jgi:hypothetical protein
MRHAACLQPFSLRPAGIPLFHFGHIFPPICKHALKTACAYPAFYDRMKAIIGLYSK